MAWHIKLIEGTIATRLYMFIILLLCVVALVCLSPHITWSIILICVQIKLFFEIVILLAKPRNCQDIMTSGNTSSGIYTIYPFKDNCGGVSVYCNMTHGGGWTVGAVYCNVTMTVDGW